MRKSTIKDTTVKNMTIKKVTALLLILLLTLSAFGCGSDDDKDPAGDGDGSSISDESGENTDGDEDSSGAEGAGGAEAADYNEKVNEDTSDIDADDYDAEEMEASFDFGFSVSKNLGMSSMLEKLSYKDLEGLGEDLESRMNSGISSSIGGSYDVFSSYEPEEEADIDDLIVAAAMAGGEMDGRYFEGGVYHKQSTGKYYQYLRFYTENFTKVDDASMNTIQKTIKDAMGITLSESRLEKAIEIAFGNAKKTQDEYTLMGQKSIKGSGYTETVTIVVIGTTSEENESSYYVCAERERCYQ